MRDETRAGGLEGFVRRACSILVLVGIGGCSDVGSVESDESPGDFVGKSTEAITVAELFPSNGSNGPFDGRLVSTPCGEENPLGTDCGSNGAWYQSVLTPCSGGALNVVHTYPVAGTPGQAYSVKFHFYGIVEPKNYGSGVTRDAAPGRPGNQDSGATPTPFASAPANHFYPVSDFSTYELRVRNGQNNEVAAYYLNADTQEGVGRSYVLNFEKDITVIGGGTVRVRTYDRNCRENKNCGPAGTPPSLCAQKANARIINVSGANPAPSGLPAPQGGLLQPNLITNRSAGASGQWLLIDIVSVNP